MKRFIWAEVVEFLNDNLETTFDYGNYRVKDYSMPKCAMTAFFLSKKIDFDETSPNGWEAIKVFSRSPDGNIQAELINPPCKDLQIIHQDPVTFICRITGQQILNNLNNL